MNIFQLTQWIGRFPALKRTFVRIVARIPVLDMRLRHALHEAQHPRSKVRMDARHLPEDALPVYRRLQARTARRSRA